MNVLAVVAHPDDEVLGVGGTLARHVLDGDTVRVLILATGVTSRRDLATEEAAVEAMRASALSAAKCLGCTTEFAGLPDQRMDNLLLLDIVRLVEFVVGWFKPDVVYTHSDADLNRDHRITQEAVLVACRPVPGCSVGRILAFETPSATEWGTGSFRPTVFVDISGAPMCNKLAALEQYASELREFPHARSIVALKAVAALRGSMVCLEAAEAFEIVREVR